MPASHLCTKPKQKDVTRDQILYIWTDLINMTAYQRGNIQIVRWKGNKIINLSILCRIESLQVQAEHFC